MLFFFNDSATTEIYTLSLHDALPISLRIDYVGDGAAPIHLVAEVQQHIGRNQVRDRKSTRLNSSHPSISYAVFCLKKKRSRHKQLLRMTTPQPTGLSN